MPALVAIRARFEREKPFAGKKITISIHMEAKTAFLALCLLNRGRNGRSVYLLADTTNESLIKHHIPAEELNNEQ